MNVVQGVSSRPGRHVRPAPASSVGPVETFIRYSEGKGQFLQQDGVSFILLTMKMRRPDGTPDGSFQGLLQTQPLNPAALIKPPNPPPGPIDQPLPFDTVPVAGNSKGTWTFADGSSVTALGPGIVTLVPMVDGSFAFLLGGMAIVSNGTGRYAGARGIKNTLGLTILTDPKTFGQPGVSFPGQTVEVFQMVEAKNVLQLPPGGLPAPGGPPPPGLRPPFPTAPWPPDLGLSTSRRQLGKVEQMFRTSEGTGQFKDQAGKQSVFLDMAMKLMNGKPGGKFEGLLLTGPLNPVELIKPPDPPPGPIDEPQPFDTVPIGGNSKGTWSFPYGSLTALGPGIVTLVPLVDGSFAFLLAGMAIDSNGTGVYEGARGIKNTLGQSVITDPSSFGKPGGSFPGRTVEVFNTVRKDDVLELPPGALGGGAPAAGAPAAGAPAGGTTAPAGSTACVPGGALASILNAVPNFGIKRVTRLLEKAAYFSLLAVSKDGSSPATRLDGQPHRFEIASRPAGGGKLVGLNLAGEKIATINLKWSPIADHHQGDPHRPAPPIALDPSASQRFEISHCVVHFDDTGGTGFRAYGAGQTFPASGPDGPFLRVAAVMDILEGSGELAGLDGTVVVNGTLTPDGDLSLQLMVRIVNESESLIANAPLAPVQVQPGLEPSGVYLPLLGQIDPEHTVKLRTEGLHVLGSCVFELLRTSDLDFDVRTHQGLKSRVETGPIVASVAAQLDFNPLALAPITPIQTSKGVFEFHDKAGNTVGTLRANMIEGRSFRTHLDGMLIPVFRFGGFGPILGGTGIFEGASGMMTMNSLISVFPRTLSNLYILRLDDPDGRYRAVLPKG